MENSMYSETDRKLIVDVLLESYKLKRAEILTNQENYNKTLQIFMGSFILVFGYILATHSYIFSLLFPILSLSHTHIIFHNFNNITSLGASALETEHRINNLLDKCKSPILDYEIKWGGIASKHSKNPMIKLIIITAVIFVISASIGTYFFYLRYGTYACLVLSLILFVYFIVEIDYYRKVIAYRDEINKTMIINNTD